jgi:hypothetical protein
VEIVTRSGWTARDPRRRFLSVATETYLHHSVGVGAGGAAYMRQMQNQHMAPGWAGTVNGGSDIAYNHVIDPATLTVYEGRGWGVAPGAQKDHNTGTWALCVMGDYSTTRPTPDLLALIVEVIRYGHSLGHLPLALTGGHRDAPGQATTCPGAHLHRAIPSLRETLTEEPEMPLTADDIRRVWEYMVPDEDDGLGTRGAVHALRQAWGYARRASIDAAVARRLAEAAAARGGSLSPAEIEAIGAEVAEAFIEELTN